MSLGERPPAIYTYPSFVAGMGADPSWQALAAMGCPAWCARYSGTMPPTLPGFPPVAAWQRYGDAGATSPGYRVPGGRAVDVGWMIGRAAMVG